MGWLFGKRKIVPRVPFPEGRPLGDEALRLPPKILSERVIKPEEFKAAAGFEQPSIFPEEEISEAKDFLPGAKPKTPLSAPSTIPEQFPTNKEPLFVKVGVYQNILGDLNEIKSNISTLYEVNRHLENSEYNEEENFGKIKRDIKLMHDKLLLVDKIIFKAQS